MGLYAIGVVLAGLLYMGVLRLALGRRGLFGALVAITATTVIAVWLTFFVISLSDYEDADGWIDCNNSCSNLQIATGATLFYGLAALALLLVLSGITTIVGRIVRSR